MCQSLFFAGNTAISINGMCEDVSVSGASLGIVEQLVEGRCLDHPMTSEDACDGKVALRIKNLVPNGNAVISYIEWVDAAP